MANNVFVVSRNMKNNTSYVIGVFTDKNILIENLTKDIITNFKEYESIIAECKDIPSDCVYDFIKDNLEINLNFFDDFTIETLTTNVLYG